MKISVVFVGQIGVGKSTLINMIVGIPDHSQVAARVGHSARPITLQNAFYSCVLTTGLRCWLWDTRGLDAEADDDLMVKMARRIPQRSPTDSETIFVWCMQASKIDFPSSWKQFRVVYEEYCRVGKGVVPVIVVTQIGPGATGWELTCKNQIRQLGSRVGLYEIDNILLLGVRKHRGASSPEYIQDSKALRDHLIQLAQNPPSHHLPSSSSSLPSSASPSLTRLEGSGWRRPGAVPYVACREVVVGMVYATVHATDDWSPATAPGPLPPPTVTWPDCRP